MLLISSKSLPPLVVATLITNFLALPSILVTNTLNAKREINLKVKEKKIEVYSKFIELWVESIYDFTNERVQTNNCEQKIEEFGQRLHGITDDLILWGSDKVLKEYISLREQFTDENFSHSDQSVSLIQLAKFIMEIRKDLGYKNQNLDEYDLILIFSTPQSSKGIKFLKKYKKRIDVLLDEHRDKEKNNELIERMWK